MDKIRIKNLRSIEDSGEIDIKPLTLLLGKNSCGKSTLARFFPLMKQTLEEKPRESMLWYGKYVDFGDYKTSRPNFNKNSQLSFSTDFHLNHSFLPFFAFNLHDKIDVNKALDGKIEITLSQKNITEVTIFVCDQTIRIDFDEEKPVAIIDGIKSSTNFLTYPVRRTFLPTITIGSKFRDAYFLIDEYCFNSFKNEFSSLDVDQLFFSSIVKNLFKIQTKSDLAKELNENTDLKLLKDYCDSNEQGLSKLNCFIISTLLPYLLLEIDEELSNTFESSLYIKPVRVHGERYYRIQGLNVDEVDPDGTNVPVFLSNLTKAKLGAFNNWCKKTIGVGFNVESTKGHISITVESSDNDSINLIDTGYGYSQILPIMLQIWSVLNKNDNDFTGNTIVVVIEQPELHLHPAMQKQLAKVFCSVSRKNKNIRLVIETHSQTIINEIGSFVRKKEKDEDDINIILVEKQSNKTVFTQTSFDNEGFINNWPIGFLSE